VVKAGLRSALSTFGHARISRRRADAAFVKAYAARATRILPYVLVEVDRAVNHDCPNRKVNDDWKDYFHKLFLPVRFPRSVALDPKDLNALTGTCTD
jgi:hypothetical protein